MTYKHMICSGTSKFLFVDITVGINSFFFIQAFVLCCCSSRTTAFWSKTYFNL